MDMVGESLVKIDGLIHFIFLVMGFLLNDLFTRVHSSLLQLFIRRTSDAAGTRK